MTDHPLDLRPHEVRAALDGRLSLIVRPLKVQPKWPENMIRYCYKDFGDGQICHLSERVGCERPDCEFGPPELLRSAIKIPFTLGDRLWCREAWRVGAWHYNNSEVALDYVDGPRKEWLCVDDPDQLHRLIDQSREDAQKANVRLNDLTYYEYTWPPGHGPTRWRPSITMPRWASRLTLTVNDVDVKRVQEITEEEALKTGARSDCHGYWTHDQKTPDDELTFWFERAKLSFQDLWTTTHGSDAWDRNDWCAFYSVTVHTTNIDMEG